MTTTKAHGVGGLSRHAWAIVFAVGRGTAPAAPAPAAWMYRHPAGITWIRQHPGQWQWVRGHQGQWSWIQGHPAAWAWMRGHMASIGWMHDNWNTWQHWQSSNPASRSGSHHGNWCGHWMMCQ